MDTFLRLVASLVDIGRPNMHLVIKVGLVGSDLDWSDVWSDLI